MGGGRKKTPGRTVKKKRTRSTRARGKTNRPARGDKPMDGVIARHFPNGAIFLFDRDLRYTLADGAGFPSVGLTPEMLVGKTIFEALAPDGATLIEPYYRGAIEGRSSVLEAPFGGRLFESHVVPVRNKAGKVVAGMVVSQDITDKKRTEDARRRAEERYRAFVENSSEAIWCYETETPIPVDLPEDEQIAAILRHGYLGECNDAMARMYGLESREKLIGVRLRDFLLPHDPGNVEIIRAFIRSGYRLTDAETHEPAANGEMRVFLNSFIGVVENGKLLRAWGTQRDVTEQRRADAALRAVIQASPLAILTLDRDGIVTTWNPAAERMFGWTAQEAIGRLLPFVPPEKRDESRALRERALRGEQVAGLELERRRKDGSPIDVSLSTAPVCDATGAITGVMGVVADITERRRAEEALRQSETNLRAFVDNAVFGIYRSSVDGRLLMANQTLATMLGYDSIEELLLVDMARDLYLRPDDRQRLVQRYGEQARLEEADVVWKRKDGRPVTLRLSGHRVRDAKGAVTAFEMIVQDVTEQLELELQLQQVQKMESLGQFAGGMAHDFNNLLTTILSSVEMLATELPADSSLRADLDVIKRAGERGAELTRRLLAFGRRRELEMQPARLGDLVTGFTHVVRRMLPADIEIAVRIDRPDTTIRVGPGTVEQILMNLVTNARDAMPAGGAITIEVGEALLDAEFCRAHDLGAPGVFALLAVRDTGSGMDRETLRHMFEPFFTTKPVGKGSGLGMAMVYGLVKQHGGAVHLYSERGEGTTVKLLFPTVPAGERGLAHRAEPAAAVRGGAETILLVEDEESLRHTAARVLRKNGYTVITAADGAEALETFLARERDIHLIVTDVVMPRLGGPQLLDELRRRGKHPKIIFTSGYTARDVQESKAFEPGLPFVSKPWTITELLTRVREVLDRPSGA